MPFAHLAFLFFFLVTGQLVSLDLDRDALLVRQVFREYKSALISGNGKAAVELVDQATLEYYDRLKRLTLEGDVESIKAESFINRLLIISLRHELDPQALAAMQLEDLIAHVVEEGWISRESIEQLDMGKIEVDGDQATGQALVGGNPAGLSLGGGEETEDDSSSLRYRFTRQGGEWKFQFSSLVESLNETIQRFSDQLGTDEDDLIFTLVEALSGEKVLPEVWEKPQQEE